MEVKDIDIIESNLKMVKSWNEQVVGIINFLKVVNDQKHLNINNGKYTLYLPELTTYELIGNELISALEDKKTQLEKKIYNFKLDDLTNVET